MGIDVDLGCRVGRGFVQLGETQGEDLATFQKQESMKGFSLLLLGAASPRALFADCLPVCRLHGAHLLVAPEQMARLTREGLREAPLSLKSFMCLLLSPPWTPDGCCCSSPGPPPSLPSHSPVARSLFQQIVSVAAAKN